MLSIISRTPSHVHRLSSRSRPVSWASANDESFAESMVEDDRESLPENAAAPLPTDMVAVRSTGNATMGDGLFATRDIKQGTTIFTESPLLTVPPPPSRTTTTSAANNSTEDITDPSAFCALLRDLPRDTLRDLDSLSCNPAHVNAATRARVRQWYKDQGMTNAGGEVLKGKKLQDATKAPVRRFGIYLTNRVPIEAEASSSSFSFSSSSSSDVGRTGNSNSGSSSSSSSSSSSTSQQQGGPPPVPSAIFPLYSRVNHSCIPNARRMWVKPDPSPNPHHPGNTDQPQQPQPQPQPQLALYAVRDIKAGEQVLASYVRSYACRTRAQRARDLGDLSGGGDTSSSSFACACLACADPDVEAARQRSLVLSRGLGHYANPVARRIGAAIGRAEDCRYRYVPRTAAEALEWAEELVALLEAQGLYGPELCKIYREASEYSLETGALQKALDHAYKEVDLGRCIVGTESEYLDKDAQDADTWVKHLQKERFRNLRQFWERGR